MKYKHTHRPGFLLGAIDFCTAGLFFLLYMPLSVQKEIDEILISKEADINKTIYVRSILKSGIYYI